MHMRVFLNVLKNDLARTVCSKAFVFAALGLTAATFLTGMDELSYMTPENDLIYIYGIFQYLDFKLLYLLFAAIPGAAQPCPSRPSPASPSSSPARAKSSPTSSPSIPTAWPAAFWVWAT